MELSEIQQKTLRFILDYRGQHGYPPSEMEIAKHFGVTQGAVRARIARLELLGLLTRKPRSRRTLVLSADGVAAAIG